MIYIISGQAKCSIGHFWLLDRQIRQALIELDLPFVYINPDAHIAQNDDLKSSEVSNEYMQLPFGPRYLEQAVACIKKNRTKFRGEKFVLLFTFMSQFEISEIQALASTVGIAGKNLSIVGITMHTKDFTFKGDYQNRYVGEDLFIENPTFKILWVNEEVPNDLKPFSSIRQLPEYLTIEQATSDKLPVLSFFGSLNAYRGISEILFIALFNPGLDIYIKGHGFAANRTWRPYKSRILRFTSWREKPLISLPINLISILISSLRLLPNVHFSNVPFEDDMELDEAINKSEVIFFCAKLPYTSGIIAKALALSKPVLWWGNEGRAFSILESSFPQGRIGYTDIFIPGKMTRHYNQIKSLSSQSPFTWTDFVLEIAEMKKLL